VCTAEQCAVCSVQCASPHGPLPNVLDELLVCLVFEEREES